MRTSVTVLSVIFTGMNAHHLDWHKGLQSIEVSVNDLRELISALQAANHTEIPTNAKVTSAMICYASNIRPALNNDIEVFEGLPGKRGSDHR